MPEEKWKAEFPDGPPSHVNCRCSTSLTLDDAATVEAEALASQTAREREMREKVEGEKPREFPKAEDVRLELEKVCAPMNREIEQRSREMNRLLDEKTEEHPLGDWESWSVLQKENAAQRSDYYAKARAMIYREEPSHVGVIIRDKLNPHQEDSVVLGAGEFRKLIGTGNGLDTRTIFIRPTYSDSARSNCSGTHVRLNGAARERTVIHELGHALEHSDGYVAGRARMFLDERTRGEEPEWLGDDYREAEVTKRDKFLDPYMGKIYPSGNTEIISMGLEEFWADPLKFASEDPEYFDFIYDLLRGQ